MNLESILDELRSQRTRIDRAIAALQGTARNSRPAQATRVLALAAYRDFLILWKDADPDIPIDGQAKTEYAKLQ